MRGPRRDCECDGSAAIFLNRLSDYLFVSARFSALHAGEAEVAYKKARAAKEPASVEGAEAAEAAS